MENLEYKYKQLGNLFHQYKKESEEEINNLKEENYKMGKKLAIFYNVVEISNYINSFISQSNLIQLINDMILGVLGATYSTIFLIEDNKLNIKATNGKDYRKDLNEIKHELLNYGQAVIIDTKYEESQGVSQSKMVIPIKVGEKLIGYILVEHSCYKYFNNDHKMFITTVANQIGIAIENSGLYRKLEIVAETDALIGIYNRRTFYKCVEDKISNKKNYAMVMIDIDDFKNVNDTLGHQFGDEVLVRTTEILKEYLGEKDLIGRYGGEEIILYIDDVDDYNKVFERIDFIREKVMNNTIEKFGHTLKVTASFGIGFSPQDGNCLADIVNTADRMLYKAKHLGKNKVISSVK